jgi:Polyketide cyclase / dehydrase and lipid transport
MWLRCSYQAPQTRGVATLGGNMSADTFVVERQAVIAAPASRISAEITDFHRWVDWSPWEGLDPALQRTYGGAADGVGATYAWKGTRKVGQGNMEILAVTPSAVDVKINFIKPFAATNDTRFALVEQNGATTVTWTMTGKLKLVNKIMGIFMSMDKLVGKDFEKGLRQLRSVVESASKP